MQPATRAPEGGVTYATALSWPVAPFQPSGSLKPTAMESDTSEPAVASETVNRRILATCLDLWATSQMAPLPTPRWSTPAYQQESVPIRHTFLFQESWHPFLPGLVASVLPWRSDGPTKDWEADGRPVNRKRFQSLGQRAAVPRRGGRCEFSHLQTPGGPLCAALGKSVWERRLGGVRVPGHSCSGSHAAAFRPSRPGPSQGPPSQPTSLYRWRGCLRCPKCNQSPNSAACLCRWRRT